ncbi:hypothetical protein A0O00_12860 [Proteus mirabilis]|nr:hypothetical protein A0O00_12860 [Proteus mirabilis]
MSVKKPSRLADDFWISLKNHPYEFDLFQVLRLLDAQGGATWPLGKAPHPYQEPIRLGQQPSLSFAPSTLASVEAKKECDLHELMIYSFGLLGPNGPMPLHFTEYVRERYLHHQDRTFVDFLNLFHHRLILLFYRAWADSQPAVSLDREDNQAFSHYISSLIGMGSDKGLIPRDAKCYMAGHFARQHYDAEGLAKILSHYFQLPVQIIENIPVWLPIETEQQTRLSMEQSAKLGQNSFLGLMTRDIQHKFRIELGPMTLSQYQLFLPGNKYATELRDWVRHYVGIEYLWDVRLILHKEEVTRTQLGGMHRLGLNSWLRDADNSEDANDLFFMPENFESEY